MSGKLTGEEFEKLIPSLERADKTLVESEIKYRSLTHNLNVGIYRNTAGDEGKFLEANPAIVEMFEYCSREEFLKAKVSDLYKNPHEREAFKKELIKNGSIRNQELELQTKNGRLFIGSVSAVVVKNEKGAIKYFDGVIEDITKQKQTEDALRESEERYRALFDASFEAIFLSEKGICLDQNQTAERMFGYTLAEAVGKPGMEWISLEDREQVKKNMLSGYEKPYQVTALRKDGTTFPAEIQGKMINIAERSIRVTVLRDITERKRAEEELKNSEEKYRSMMDAMVDSAYITTSEFRISYMNPRMINRLGRDATGEPCHKAIYNCDEKCPWCAFGKVKQGEHVEYELANPEDNRYYFITSSPINHSEDSFSLLTIARDITKNKEIEEQLRQSRKMESIGTMAGGVAHDFNNILYMITGNTELAMEDIPEWNPVYANLKEIRSASLKAAGIVKQLLSFSRKTEFEMKPIGAITVIKDSLKFLRSTIPASVEIRKHLPDKELTIFGDPIQLNQVLMNICSNASQVMEKNGGILEINVEKKLLPEDSGKSPVDLESGVYLKIEISDTGPGIDPKIINRIFDPYFTTKEIGKGSGMGLAVVQGIIQNHNGIITTNSNPGEGSTFTILLPLVDKEPEMEVKTFDEIPHGNC